MPDMVEYAWTLYPGGADAAIDNKVIISLNKYLKEYAPDYYDYIEGERGRANDYLYKEQSLDAAVAKAKKDGMDEIRDIYQKAYDRYINIK